MKKKKPTLIVSLDRAWVEEEVVAPGTIKRSKFQERDERLKRAWKHPVPPEWRLTLWCQEEHNGEPCNTLLAQVLATSEGNLWEARVEGFDQGDLAFRRMASLRAKEATLPRELHAFYQWLDSGTNPLSTRYAQHGSVAVDHTSVVGALAEGKKHLHRRGGQVIFG